MAPAAASNPRASSPCCATVNSAATACSCVAASGLRSMRAREGAAALRFCRGTAATSSCLSAVATMDSTLSPPCSTPPCCRQCSSAGTRLPPALPAAHLHRKPYCPQRRPLPHAAGLCCPSAAPRLQKRFRRPLLPQRSPGLPAPGSLPMPGPQPPPRHCCPSAGVGLQPVRRPTLPRLGGWRHHQTAASVPVPHPFALPCCRRKGGAQGQGSPRPLLLASGACCG